MVSLDIIFPKGMDFSSLTQKDVAIVENIINNKFRQPLNYNLALELYNKNI